MKFKKYLSIGLIAVLTGLSTVSYAVELSGDTAKREHIEERMIEGLEVSESSAIKSRGFIYSEDQLKTEIHSRMVNRTNEFSIQYAGSEGIDGVMNTVKQIYEEINSEDKYLHGHISEFGWSASGTPGNWNITISAKYSSTKSQEDELEAEVSRIYSEIIKDGMTDFEKIKAINDYIVLNTEYSRDVSAGVSEHSAYAVLKEGKGVCSGYALSIFKLAERAGIEVDYITGEAGGDLHGWNLVKLDGQWYHLDATWNDPVPDRKGLVRYKYFLAPDSHMKLTHSWQGMDYSAATNNSYSWMRGLGYAITVGDTIYFSSESNESLQKINMDGTQSQTITQDRAPYFTVAGDTIYFSNYSRNGYLYSVGINGENQTKLNSTHSTDVYLEGNKVYYTDMNSGTQKYIEVEIKQPVLAENILVDKDNISLELDGQIKIGAAVQPSDAENGSLIWQSINPNIATVDQSGNIKGIAAGDTFVVVSTADKSISKIVQVKVNDTYVKHRAWPEKGTVSNSKIWTVKLSGKIDASSMISDNIYIIDGQGNRVDGIKLVKGEDGLSVEIVPSSPYSAGIYYLTVENIKSESGKTLIENIRMKFRV